MSNLHVAFSETLTKISAADCILSVRDAAAGNAQQEVQDQTVNQKAVDTLSAIAQSLSELETSRSDLTQQFGSQISLAAAQIARAVLNDPELFQDRSLKFVQIAMEQIESTAAKTAYVHPTCLDTIRSWIESATIQSLSVSADESVAPGDCRIDCGDTGVAATLDAFFECISLQTQSTQ